MVNKVKVEVAGASYTIATSEQEGYVRDLAKEMSEDIDSLMVRNPSLSMNDALVLCSIAYLSEYKKEALITYDDTTCFAENRHTVKNGGEFTLDFAPSVYICVEGNATILGDGYEREIKQGEYFYLPYVAEGKFKITAKNSATFIECLPSKQD